MLVIVLFCELNLFLVTFKQFLLISIFLKLKKFTKIYMLAARSHGEFSDSSWKDNEAFENKEGQFKSKEAYYSTAI